MAITITAAEIRRKCGIADTDTSHDSAITSLIAEMQPALEYSIAETYLNDISDSGLQSTLKLGITEIIAGEFLEQLRREVGGSEQFSVAGISIGEWKVRGVELIQQGATRLAPYLKNSSEVTTDSVASSTTSDTAPVFSRQEVVW